MQKQTPKSCSCRHCKIGKSRNRGLNMMKYDERKFRHNQKIKLNKMVEEYDGGIAPKGNYYD